MCLIRLKHPFSRIFKGPKADFQAISFVTSKRRRKREKLSCQMDSVTLYAKELIRKMLGLTVQTRFPKKKLLPNTSQQR